MTDGSWFAGRPRRNLVEWLETDTTAQLWQRDASHLLARTSAL
jgi:hypothetical protein